MQADNEFEVLYNLAVVQVQQLQQEPNTYRVRFSNEVPEMLLTSTAAADGTLSWQSSAAGNAELAAGIGKLIEGNNDKNDHHH